MVDNLIYFPVRRICALGVPREALAAVHDALPWVAIEADGAALQRCDLLVLDAGDSGAPDLVRWVRQRVPQCPVVFWSKSVSLVETCRALLFPGGTFAA